VLSPRAAGHGRQGRKLAGVSKQFDQPVSLIITSAFSSFWVFFVYKTSAPYREVNYTPNSRWFLSAIRGNVLPGYLMLYFK